MIIVYCKKHENIRINQINILTPFETLKNYHRREKTFEIELITIRGADCLKTTKFDLCW